MFKSCRVTAKLVVSLIDGLVFFIQGIKVGFCVFAML